MPGSDDETIIVRAILRDELSDQADRVDESLTNLRSSMDETANSTDNLTDAERRNQQQSERTARQIASENRARDERGRFIRTETTEVNNNSSSLRRNTRERSASNKIAAKSTKSFGKLIGLFGQFAKVGTMLDAVVTAAPGVMALGAAGIAAGAGLSQLSGAALPLPALMLGVGQAMGVMKMATSGMGDAVKALSSGEFDKFAEATKDMSPAAIATAKSLGEMGQQFTAMKKDIQGKVFEGLSARFDTLGKNIMPAVKASFMGTAEGINTGVKALLDFTNSAQGLRQVKTILAGTSTISKDFAIGMGDAGRAAIGMLSATMPVAKQMSEQLRAGMNSLANSIQANQGKITAFAQRGYDLFRRIVGVLVDLGKGIFNIGKQSLGLAGFMGNGIEDMARKFEQWTSSVQGQNKISQVFAQAKPVLQAVGNLIGVVATEFGKLATNAGNNQNLINLINKLAEMVPIMADIAQQAGGNFLPSLMKIADAVLRIVEGMDTMGPMAILMSAVAEPTAMLADAFTALPGPIQQTIGYLVMFGLAVKTAAASALGQYILQTQFATAWTNYFKLALSSTMARMKAFAAAKMATALTAIKTGFMAAATAVRAFSMSLLSFLFTNPIGWIILAVIALVAVFVILWKKCEGFRNVVKAIGQWFVDVWNNTLFPIIMKVWEWMKMAWDKVYAVVSTVVMAIVNWFRSNWDTIKAIAMGVFNALKTYVMIMFNIYKAIFLAIVAVVKFVFNLIKTIVTTAFNVIKAVVLFFAPVFIGAFKLFVSVVRLVFTVIKAIITVAFAVIKLIVLVVIYAIIQAWKGLVAVWRFIWSIVMAVVRPIWAAIKIGWTFLWNTIKTVFMAVWNAILAVIRFLAPIVQGVMNFVSMIFTTAWNIIKMVASVVFNAIAAVIRTIIGVVMTVGGAIRSGFSSAWNFVSGIVSSVVGTIRGIIDTISGVVTRVAGSVRSGFEGAFNAVKNVVGGVIDTIKGWIDSITSKINSMKDGIVGVLDTINPFNFAGGPITAGTTSYVGELGPEAFVTHTGKVEMIGERGMELRTFNRPGYIVPNHVLNGVADSSVPKGVMNKLAKANAPQPTMGTQTSASGHSRLSSNDYMKGQQGGGNNYTINIHGSGSNEIRTAVVAAVRDIERSNKERD